MRKRFYKPLVILGGFLFLIGAGGLLFPFLPFGLSGDLDYLDAVAEARVSLSPTPTAEQLYGVSPTNQYPTSPLPTVDPNRPSIKDRVIIERIGISMPIYESSDADILIKGGWMFPGTSTPEQGSNTVIFGHRFRYLPPISNTFYALDKIRYGDLILVQWQGKTYRYTVTETKIIEPTDFSVLNASDKSIITLITCAPLFSTKQRLVVVAESF